MLSIIFLYLVYSLNIFNLNIFFLSYIIIIIVSLFLINLHSKETQQHDSKKIVIDEFIGIYSIFLFYDFIFIYNNIFTCLLIFIFFRFFDIIKIFPANLVDKKMSNSFVVILDDIIASIYTLITIYLLNVYT